MSTHNHGESMLGEEWRAAVQRWNAPVASIYDRFDAAGLVLQPEKIVIANSLNAIVTPPLVESQAEWLPGLDGDSRVINLGKLAGGQVVHVTPSDMLAAEHTIEAARQNADRCAEVDAITESQLPWFESDNVETRKEG